MRDLPGDLGLNVIDELPEMIGWVKGLFDFFIGKLSFFGGVFLFPVYHFSNFSKATVGIDLVNVYNHADFGIISSYVNLIVCYFPFTLLNTLSILIHSIL